VINLNLLKDFWQKEDILEFQKYLENLKNEDKISWTKNIINTKNTVLAIKANDLKKIAKEISKGNYLSFLNLMPWFYYENTAINGYLINKIKDFKIQKKYLDIYSYKADNWSTCDLLKFKTKNKENEYLNLVYEYIKSPKPFQRRIGLSVLFNFINKKYINTIFSILNLFYEEEHYYVKMMLSWLLCECFIKEKKETINYLNNHNLNKWVINKAISKCRDSLRISKKDKDFLLKYKIN